MTEQLSPERAIRLLRAKAAALESEVLANADETMTVTDTVINSLAADIALVMQLFADHIEQVEQRRADANEPWR